MKRTYIFGGIGLLLLIIVIIFNYQNKIALKEYKYTYNTMNNEVNITLYASNQNKANQVFEDIKNTYNYYAQLGDSNNHYDGMTNLYDIKNNNSSDQYISINIDLINMINESLYWSAKSNCTVSIMDVCNNPNISFIKDNTILNSHVSINLDKILMGYATKKATSMIESDGLMSYSLSYGSNYVFGKYYTFGKYSLGLKNDDKMDVFKTLKITNNAVSTYKSAIDGIRSVTVISSDATNAYLIGYILSNKSIDEGKDLLKGMNVDAIWYTNKDEIVTTDGVSDYE